MNAEDLPPLETPCPQCEGRGGDTNLGKWQDCPYCDGAGHHPTDAGEKVLALIRHNLRTYEKSPSQVSWRR